MVRERALGKSVQAARHDDSGNKMHHIFNEVFCMHNLKYKIFTIQHFQNTVYQISLPAQACTADTLQMTILQKLKQYFLFI